MSRGVGDAVTPLWTPLAIIIALVCTPAFIQGWWGLPKLGVASAAVSTLLAFALAMTWTLPSCSMITDRSPVVANLG